MSSRIQSISIHFVPQAEQRYPTLGDWQVVGDEAWQTLQITVTQMPDQRMSWPIALHELVEALTCHAHGLSTADVDAWDITGPGRDDPDPGSMEDAPYHEEHMHATKLELDFVAMLGIEESDYTMYIDSTEEQIKWPR